MDEAERLATRLAVIDHGTMIASDTPRALIDAHVEPEVIEVFGDDAKRVGRRARPRACAAPRAVAGETAFCYANDPQPLLDSARARARRALPAPSRQSRGPVHQADRPRAARLGPVHAMDANANGRHGAPVKAPHLPNEEAKTGRLREEGNAEWRSMMPVPFGLLPKTPITALRSLAGYPTRLRLRALCRAFSAVQRVCAHSVSRP